MRILGIDPGYGTTGFGVIESDRNGQRVIRYGAVTTPVGLEFAQRLVILYDDITELIQTFSPDAVAVEELFWGHNVTTGIQVSHGRGVILLAVAKAGVPLFEYTPMQVKQRCV